ncbi:MAG: SUF system Fe-S cluster assembly regulator [Proteobacteria bacterium]|nr:SUF system Fe-S cluster assembly regulator [Pseudomonadota bacterium]
MIRLSKLADYGVVLMARMAARPEGVHNTVDLSLLTGLPTPTVSKVLAKLGRQGLVRSVRGAKGGYRLAQSPENISVADIISAIEGPIALTQCMEHTLGCCDIEPLCPSRYGWQVINDTVRRSLESVSLAEISTPVQLFAARRAGAGASAMHQAPSEGTNG